MRACATTASGGPAERGARLRHRRGAGFVGFHVARALSARGDDVLGFDNVNDYYDPGLKEARLSQLAELNSFQFRRAGLEDALSLRAAIEEFAPETVIHLAAQAGVRYSLENPQAYVDSNLVGFTNVLEACRHAPALRHLLFASSSSVYGANVHLPFSTTDNTDYPVSLYAATKKANEVLAHAYSHLFDIPMTGLRFFTVYGPWGRPDMAYFSFTRAILQRTPIRVFNHGRLQRDFTYIDDIVEGVLRVADAPPKDRIGDSGAVRSAARYALHNIGNHSPVALEDFIATLESLCGKSAVREYVDMQPGDVHATYADVDSLRTAVGFSPDTPIEDGLRSFVAWYRDYYAV